MIVRTIDGRRYSLVPFDPRTKSGGTRKMFGALYVTVTKYHRRLGTNHPTLDVRCIRADTIIATVASRPLPELIKLRELRDLDRQRQLRGFARAAAARKGRRKGRAK
jgi:hypothetical protein